MRHVHTVNVTERCGDLEVFLRIISWDQGEQDAITKKRPNG